MSPALLSAQQGIDGERRRLALSVNAVMLIQAALLFYLRRERGASLLVPGFGLLGILAWGQWAIRAGGTQAFAYRWIICFYLLGGLTYWGIRYPHPGLPPTLYLFINTSLFFHLGWGPRLGWASFGLSLLGMAAIRAATGPYDPYEERAFLGMLLAMGAMQATAHAYESTFQGLWTRSVDLRTALERESEQRNRAVSELLDQLEQPLADGGAADHAQAAALAEGLQKARKLRDALPPPAEPHEDDAQLPQRLLLPLLAMGFAIAAFLGLRDLLLEPEEAFISLGAAAAFGSLALLIRARPQAWRQAALATLLAGACAIVAGVLRTRPVHMPEALVYGHVLMVFAAFWLGPGTALAAGSLLMGLDLWWLHSFSQSMPQNHIDGGINLLQQWLLMTLVLAPAASRQQALLEGVERQGRALAAGLRVRRRLLGTLFHDAANHVVALNGLLDLQQHGLAEEGDRARFDRLRGRLRELLSSARQWLLDERDFAAHELQALSLRVQARGAEELFRERLGAKGLRWEAEIPAGLRVRAHEGLLADGVLGNLVSNAIKFSPPGGALRLRGWAQGSWACLSVEDEGEGLPESAVQAFSGGAELANRPGTLHEPGQGLGLGLAREHLRRMGGRLELIAAGPQGGGCLRIWLPLA